MKAQIKIIKRLTANVRYFALLLLLSTVASLNSNIYSQGRTPARPTARPTSTPYDRQQLDYDDNDEDYNPRDRNYRGNQNNQNQNQNNRRNENYDYRSNNNNNNGNYRNNGNPQNNNVKRTPAPDARTVAAAKKDSIEKAQKDSARKASFCRHEFSFWGGGGLSTLSYKTSIGDKTNLIGGNVGLGYTIFFNEYIGLMIGAEAACYNAKITIANFHDRYATNDADGRPIIYNAKVRRYMEKDHLSNLNIPLLAQFQTSIFGNEHKLYINLGFKLGIPMSKIGLSSLCKYSSEAELQASGTYTDYNQTLFDQEDLGYGDRFAGEKKTGKLDFKLSYMAEADAGVKWKLGRRFSLYTGIYFDYAFNDVITTHKGSFLEYNHLYPQELTYNSVLTSQYVQNPDNPSLTRTPIVKNKVSPLAVGLKLKLGVNMCKLSPKEKKEEDKKKKKPEDDSLEESLNGKKKNKPKVVLDAEDDDRKRLNDEYGPVKDVSVLYVESYDINVSKLSPVMKMMLDKRIESLRKYNSDRYQIICEGHACDIGTTEANLNIGQARANTVRKYLISKGFKAKNVVAITKGDSNPVVPNDSEVNRKINRRVVFVVVEK